jgi:hypothetical protein
LAPNIFQAVVTQPTSSARTGIEYAKASATPAAKNPALTMFMLRQLSKPIFAHTDARFRLPSQASAGAI